MSAPQLAMLPTLQKVSQLMSTMVSNRPRAHRPWPPGRQRVASALKEASELYLATDEDREGEAISWHLLQHLKPKVPVKRMVFHEITRGAIDHAVENPREIDESCRCRRNRRILDRLYGYEVSPILWRKVNRGLSAGRAKPSTRLIVERERERIAFISAGYWSIDLDAATTPAFTARLVVVDGKKVATGKDFGADGRPSDKVVAIDGRAHHWPKAP